MDKEKIIAQIIALKKADLALRDQLIEHKQLGKGYHPDMEELHIRNAETLNQIIDTIGYPTHQKVGKEANQAAWLVVQHAISKPAFMKKCATLLAQQKDLSVEEQINLAYLTDRIAVYENRPQLYGTQFDWDENGDLNPNPYDDIHLVNQRRADLGLNTIEEQTLIIRKQAKAEHQLPPQDLQQRRIEFEAWKKKVGWL